MSMEDQSSPPGDQRPLKRKSITLIGMPGAGKSTVGVLLAKRLVKRFIDTDLLIQEETGCALQTIIDQQGYLALRKIEHELLCSLDPRGAIVATGGSAIYSATAMQHLAAQSLLIYLQIPFEVVQRRIGDFSDRGIARADGTTLQEVFDEREPLYQRWADITVSADQPAQEVLVRIEQAVVDYWTRA